MHPETTPLDSARADLLNAITPRSAHENVPLHASIGRFAASDIISTVNLPATANAAVDGYAIDAETLAANPDHLFPIAGQARAGHPFTGTIAKDEAVEIYTGAVMPDGVNAVAMHEDCTRHDNHVRFDKMLQIGANNRPVGENLAVGEIILSAGTRIHAPMIGQLAAAGHKTVDVQNKLTATMLSTGDEIIDVMAADNGTGFGQIYDANRPMLMAALAGEALNLHDGGIVADDRDALANAYQAALVHSDIVISSGGASDGIEDHTQAAMKMVGAECALWRLAMKPGRPMAVGRVEDKFIFCLPGNPVAAFVCAKLLIMPLLDKLAGGIARTPLRVTVPAGFSHKKKPGRAEYLRATLQGSGKDQQIQIHGRRGAGVISSLTGADGLVEIPLDNAGVEVGMPLAFLPFVERGL
ncbi:molybdopterin molybdotransferase MoeA [Candidatus Puniceispirillum marinum]|uniref:Molybdopterin molybdenumtransferase n=1 Tax=Puniceispirillum marinum (strain IMCC1322) TaxID=488538 RepID=D5BQN5_PUNMI|nr:molybdopterin molybdotransferase MoeA [Candidatus Puniceispirillum marinum]ADE40753.1 molybdopterin biosynthesis protein MoeA [Candidatus Puniceispirillum marinum IMCC1322]